MALGVGRRRKSAESIGAPYEKGVVLVRKLLSILAVTNALALLVPVAALAAKASPFPNWSQQINTTKRFTVLAAFGGSAVLDNETGLVWEQAPTATTFEWQPGAFRCYALELGG